MQQSHFSIEYKVSDTWKLFTQAHNENSAIYIARDLAKSVHGLRVINPIGETVYISEQEGCVWRHEFTSIVPIGYPREETIEELFRVSMPLKTDP